MLLLERHKLDCSCSYCMGENKLHYGLNIPKRWKEWNSWYVIKILPYMYLRWTNRWFRLFQIRNK